MKAKTFNDTERIALILTLQAPHRRKDRVTDVALIEHFMGELDNSNVWPDPDHETGGKWEPDEGYTVTEVTFPDLYARQLTIDAEEPAVGSQVLVAGVVWQRRPNTAEGSSWKPLSPFVVAFQQTSSHGSVRVDWAHLKLIAADSPIFIINQ